jgi:hypothetical protein
MINFWKWFFIGGDVDEPATGQGNELYSKNKAGIFAYIDIWLFLHIIIGCLLMLIVPVKINDAAKSILLPLAGIFIGLTFAWGGNAVTLMQSEEINILADYKRGGLREYVFKFQAAIFVLLFTMVSWGLAGLDVFERFYSNSGPNILYRSIEVFLFFLVSLSIRDCWHVVMGAQAMILYKRKIRKAMDKSKTNGS